MRKLIPVLMLLTLFALPVHSDAAGGSAPRQLAFTRNNNIALMTALGGDIRALTTRGTGYGSTPRIIAYPAYSWSPDGRYLLIVKFVSGPRFIRSEMLLFDQGGRLLRSLGAIPAPTDFFPNWAVDGDQIAFVARQQPGTPQRGFYQAVNRVDIAGRRAFLFAYYAQEGCGGGTSDPAAQVYWRETGFGGSTTTMQWSLTRHLALHSLGCGTGLTLVDTRARTSRVLGNPRSSSEWGEAVLSTTGRLAVVIYSIRGGALFHQVALAGSRSGALLRIIGPGELPAWSRDGATLYYVRRTSGRFLHMGDQLGNDTGSQTYRSAIWRTDASGQRQTRLFVADAYGFGPLNVTAEGRVLIFSRVDNAWTLYRDHLRGPVSAAQARRDLPPVRIERLDIGQGLTTLVAGAGQPAVQP